MYDTARYLPALLLILGTCSYAQSEIHRCTQEDGTVAFQQMPCEKRTDPLPKDAAGAEDSQRNNGVAPDSGDDAFDFSSPYDRPADPPQPVPKDSISRDRATCEKSARDAIDAIDLELRKNPGRDDRQLYLDELLELTQRLRECKRL